MTEYHNFNDAHVPAPSDHAQRTHAFRDGATLVQDARLVIAAFDDRESFDSDGRWIAAKMDATVDVKP